MSAICGVFHPDGRPIDHQVLDNMLDTLAYRGPDGKGRWTSGSIGLGCHFLFTTPESQKETILPINQDGSHILAADVRVDNRAELIEALEIVQQPRNEITDSALILSAYAKWGERCPEKIIGDFAFVIWDERKQILFCARDPMGVKPFYYYHSERIFAFGSEIRALLVNPDVPSKLNELRVAEFLVHHFENKKHTFYKGVYRLPPAHWLKVTSQGLQMERYWAPDLANEIDLGSRKEYIEAFREVFITAIECRLRSAYPIGSTLSGGLDSSSIVCTAGKILSETGRLPLHTFSAIFPSLAEVDPRIDEREYIHAVLETGDFVPHFIEADRLSPIQDIYWQGEEPMPGLNLNMDQAFFSLAYKDGIRPFLTGHDGDTTIAYGFELLSKFVQTGRWLSLVKESTALSQRMNVSRKRIIWHLGIKPIIPDIIRHRVIGNHQELPWDENIPIKTEFAENIELREHIQSNQQITKRSTREKHWASLEAGIFSYSLEVLDKIAAPYHIEPRHPYFDRRLIEFSLSVPLHQKMHQGWTRAILRFAMDGFLPEFIRWRTNKGNLSANFLSGLLRMENIKIQKILYDYSHILEPFLDLNSLRRVYRVYESNPLHEEKNALIVNTAVILGLWLRNQDFA